MSELKVEIVEIDAIEEHPNADRLDLATIKGWQCVVQRDKFIPGDKVVYFPIDSILPNELEAKIFGIDSKVRLSKSRVKTIKLRGAISEGLAVPLDLLGVSGKVGKDLTDKLGVKKHEPQNRKSGIMSTAKAGRKQVNPNFKKYTSIENIKNYNKLFNESDLVIVSEKIHGTNFRAGWVPFNADTLWKKIKKFFGLAPEFEFVYGSHNVQLQNKMLVKTYYDKNVYAEAVKKYNLKEILKPGQVVYGEIYGDGIQKGYTYGCKPGERKLVIFDLMDQGNYVDVTYLVNFCDTTGLPKVPYIDVMPYNLEELKQHTKGASILCPSQKIREGVVIRAEEEQRCMVGRKILKLISDDYLLIKNNTEFH